MGMVTARALLGSNKPNQTIQEAGGSDIGGRYGKRAAVMRYRWPLQEAGGGRDGGCYINRA
jgi:hypothetical protein